MAETVKNAGQELCDALEAVIRQLPAKSRNAQELARTLRVHRTLTGRVLRALRTDDALAAVSQLPRGEGLRMFLQAARSSVERPVIERAEAAIRELEGVIHRELGDWDGLEAAIAEWLPDARSRFLVANKQLVFKGMANLMGMRADVQVDTAIYYPDAGRERCDIAIIEGFLNLRRLRPGVYLPIVIHTPNPRGPRPLEYAVENVPIERVEEHYPLLDQFCSKPCPRLEPIRSGEMINYVLADDTIGAKSAVDVFAANVVRGGRPLYRAPGDPPMHPQWSAGANLPVKTLLMNLLLHEDVWPGDDPQLTVFDMRSHGLASPDDPTRALDRMDAIEIVQSLGKGVGRFRASEVGAHAEIIEHVCDRLGWHSDRLRGYRVRAQYPLLNAQYCLVFNPPAVREHPRISADG